MQGRAVALLRGSGRGWVTPELTCRTGMQAPGVVLRLSAVGFGFSEPVGVQGELLLL